MDHLETTIKNVWQSQHSATQSRIQVETWWGDEDGMVPRQGQGSWLGQQTFRILICCFRMVEQAVRLKV